MKFKIYLLIVVIILASATPIYASQNLRANFYGANAHALGGAYIASAEGASSIYWNPAVAHLNHLSVKANLGTQGIHSLINDYDLDILFDRASEIEHPSVIDFINLPEDDLYLNSLIGLNIRNFSFGLINDSYINTETDSNYEKEAEIYSLTKGIISIAKSTPIVDHIGVNLKGIYGYNNKVRIESSYEDEGIITSENKVSGQGMGIDFGLAHNITNQIKFGANIQNLVSNINWGNDNEDYSLNEELERKIIAGISAPVPILGTINSDVRFNEEQENTLHLGLERSLLLLNLRLGFYQEGFNLDNEKDNRIYTGGLGLNLPLIDVAFSGDTEHNFQASASFSF